MGIFGNIFNKSTEKSEKKEMKSVINWIPLTSISQFEEIKKKSKSKVVGIFKHSTRCVISRTVLKNFDQGFPESVSNKIDMYYLDLLSYRDVSNEVGYEFQVMHQSPQLLLIHNGITALHASHYDITQINLEKIIK
ncbi:bacillithiol system redox-active protein YtxJ [Tenacibaculum sp. 190524A05c]|uniref:Bacillithiol system protein YtxJ n=1 Tax=Tenacibaculum platacis TaxID=3137852 RepID=A0ABM9P0P7_9FLAO